ncbi:MAG: hypothetical protein UX75_C0004G0037 [Candidatus Moranbacteria bacterium GW2011_GWE2_47_10]|nr:MAG: hypothetical protein UX75_C0004G0037 [Candidatus Moranbacteria bacterium GW2011_GWE2_47_10]
MGIVLGISLQFTRAWVEPTVAPPGGNIGAPINTGSLPQSKAGILNLGSTTVNHNPAGGTWNYSFLLNASDMSSIGFHDAGHSVGSIKFQGNVFTIGGNDGWGDANVSMPGNVGIGTSSPTSKLTVNGALNDTVMNVSSGKVKIGDTNTGGVWQNNHGLMIIGRDDVNSLTQMRIGGIKPIYMIANTNPFVGFNAYYDLMYGWTIGKGSVSKYGGAFGLNPDSGQFTLGMSQAPGNEYTASAIPTKFIFNRDGNGQADTAWTTFSPYLSYNYTEAGKTKKDYQLGEVVNLKNNEHWAVEKSSSAKNLYGVVVRPEGFVSIPKELKKKTWGENGQQMEDMDNVVPVAHLGEASTRIILEPGQTINPSDYITSSESAGFGKKASRNGQTLGKALEFFDPSQRSCQEVSSIESINWPEDDGSNSEKPCFVLPDGKHVGKVMIFVDVKWQGGLE